MTAPSRLAGVTYTVRARNLDGEVTTITTTDDRTDAETARDEARSGPFTQGAWIETAISGAGCASDLEAAEQVVAAALALARPEDVARANAVLAPLFVRPKTRGEQGSSGTGEGAAQA